MQCVGSDRARDGVKDVRVGGWGTFVVGGRSVHCAKASCN